MIRRIILAPVPYLVGIGATILLASHTNAMANGRPGFWRALWGVTTGRAPR